MAVVGAAGAATGAVIGGSLAAGLSGTEHLHNMSPPSSSFESSYHHESRTETHSLSHLHYNT